MGSIGAGKTSGSGASFARAYLREQYGGLVLCATSSEMDQWRTWAALEGRTEDLIEFSPEQATTFHFLEYEARRKGRGGGLTKGIVDLLMTAVEITERGKPEVQDGFWLKAAHALLRHAVELIHSFAAYGNEDFVIPVTVWKIHEVLLSAPKKYEDLQDDHWRESPCGKFLSAAEDRVANDRGDVGDVRLAIHYFTEEFLNLAPQTRSSVEATLRAILNELLLNPMRALFSPELEFSKAGEPLCPSRALVSPDDVLSGKIVVVNIPPAGGFGNTGKLANVLWKYCVQKALQSRPSDANNQPVFIWADECQYFVTKEDVVFQSTVRHTQCAVVYLTQNLPNLWMELGGTQMAKDMVASLTGNFGTKIFHANDDAETNKWVSELFGQSKQKLRNSSSQDGVTFSVDHAGHVTKTKQRTGSDGYQEQWLPEIQANVFRKLRRGRGSNGIVEAIMSMVGQHMGADWQLVRFRQNNPNLFIEVVDEEEEEEPAKPAGEWHGLAVVAGVALLIFAVVALIRNPSHSPATPTPSRSTSPGQSAPETRTTSDGERSRPAVSAVAPTPQKPDGQARARQAAALLDERAKLKQKIHNYEVSEKKVEPAVLQRLKEIETELNQVAPLWRDQPPQR